MPSSSLAAKGLGHENGDTLGMSGNGITEEQATEVIMFILGFLQAYVF